MKIILIFILFLSGCSWATNILTIKKCEKLCADHEGIYAVNEFTRSCACKDGYNLSIKD